MWDVDADHLSTFDTAQWFVSIEAIGMHF